MNIFIFNIQKIVPCIRHVTLILNYCTKHVTIQLSGSPLSPTSSLPPPIHGLPGPGWGRSLQARLGEELAASGGQAGEKARLVLYFPAPLAIVCLRLIVSKLSIRISLLKHRWLGANPRACDPVSRSRVGLESAFQKGPRCCWSRNTHQEPLIYLTQY